MNSTELKDRTKKFAVNTIKFTDGIKPTYANVVIIKQVIRSATSVGANYRAALRGKSNPDFVNKINIIQEEADESIYWFELLEETLFSSFYKYAGLPIYYILLLGTFFLPKMLLSFKEKT